jgi:aryl sulfotransferase
MATVREPSRIYRTAVFDSRRWQRFALRPDDIVVCTAPKVGTTWMQTLIVSLLWPEGRAPAPVMVLSPWLDAEFHPLEELLARLEAQPHRRVIKSHTPADGIPIRDDVRYVFMGRDGRDVFMSFCHHHEIFRRDLRAELNVRALAEGVPPMVDWDGDVHGFFWKWLEPAALLHHVASFWELRTRPNVLLVHYADLKRDLAGEMRRVAGFLQIEVPDALWPAVVERCTFDAMKARADEIGSFWNFEGGAQSFLFKGTNGRWRDVLRPDELAAYAKRVAELLPPDAAAWLEHGRAASERDAT